MITEVHQEGRFYRLNSGRAAHYETEGWCIPADMEEGDYPMIYPACEVNEKGTREKNDGNEVIEEGQLLIPASNLDLISSMRSTGTSMDIFVRGVGVGLTHTENLLIKNKNSKRDR